MNKKELLDLEVKITSFYYSLSQEDKKTFKDDFDSIDKIFEGIYFKIDDEEEEKQ